MEYDKAAGHSEATWMGVSLPTQNPGFEAATRGSCPGE